ncbi:DJ-1/PfpI family protein [Enterococcus sp. CSURQ0835]|uniref:DJ-1/PfpI family protein n=1 Tax=Enterococcus sp. CSURQ0835 TaxID=2681394 RepID=UPI001357C762|nr:DJ-1/PfpI family protein [Enterococcus sp. CSURQ0835]
MKTALFVLLNEFADWEPAHLSSLLNGDPTWQIKTASTGKEVVSIGGFTLKSDYVLPELPKEIDLLVLIGGNSWTIELPTLKNLVAERLQKQQPVAAICGAVDFLAREGLLSGYQHTGNAQFLWQDFPKYTNPVAFCQQQVVTDQHLVTANGTAALAFCNAVLKMIHFLPAETVNQQTDLYRLGYYEYVKRYGDPFQPAAD